MGPDDAAQLVCLQVHYYNIVFNTSQWQGKQSSKWKDKLAADLRILRAAGADVILLSEVGIADNPIPGAELGACVRGRRLHLADGPSFRYDHWGVMTLAPGVLATPLLSSIGGAAVRLVALNVCKTWRSSYASASSVATLPRAMPELQLPQAHHDGPSTLLGGPPPGSIWLVARRRRPLEY